MPESLRSEGELPPSIAPSRATTVWVCIAEESLQQRVVAALEGQSFLVRLASGPQPTADVIVTDRSLADLDFADLHSRLMRGEVGVILIGKQLPADVQLPADFTRRELRLACRMLAQLVTLRRHNLRLESAANSDTLTGLPNRRALEARYAKLASSGLPVALALFDIDQFKRVNAELGYVKGDDILFAAAKTLATRAAPHFVARLGGDEFVMLWSPTDLKTAKSTTDELRHALGLAAAIKAERPISASAGLQLQEQPASFQDVLASADLALRQAKQGGGRRTDTID